MKTNLLIIGFLFMLNIEQANAQNKPLFEPSRGSHNCTNVKTAKTVSALKSYTDAKKVCLIIADVDYPGMNMTDFFNRYSTANVFYQSITEACHYNGLFNAIGNLYADNIDGLYSMPKATTDKADTMIAQCNRSGYNLNATHKVSAGGVLTITVSGNGPKATNCNLIVVITDGTNHFKQCLQLVDTIPAYLGKPVRIGKIQGTMRVSGTAPQGVYNVTCILQDTKAYAPNINLSSLPQLLQGQFERFVYATTSSILKP